MRKLCIFGDSVMKGVILNEKLKYVFLPDDRFSFIEKEKEIVITNKSKFGITAPKGKKRIENFFEKGESADVVITEYGGNDCDFDWKAVADSPYEVHYPNTKAFEFKKCYKEILIGFKTRGIDVYMMTLPPIDGERYYNWVSSGLENGSNILTWLNGDTNRIFKVQERYSEIIKEISKETQTKLIDVRKEFLKSDNYKELICFDGIHPNEKGQDIILKTLNKSIL